MKYVLLWVAVGTSPAHLGVYNDLASCKEAIRDIYLRQSMPVGIELAPEIKKKIEKMVDMQLQYDTKYQCQPEKK